MNSIEYWAMNNPVRGMIQRYYEAPRLKQLFRGNAATVLEIGCGQGTGARIIEQLFTPQGYVGVDLDSRMIRRAARVERRTATRTFVQGDASKLAFADETFTHAVDFGIIHHIPNWKDALAEIHRVLKVNGQFLFEELSAETWKHGIGRSLRRVLEHPYDEMFERQQFIEELRALGFEVEHDHAAPASLRYFWGAATRL